MFRSTMTFLTSALLLALMVMAQPLCAQIVFVQPPDSAPDEETFIVEIALDPGGVEIMGMEISLSFDANIVHLDRIDPGPWFSDLGHEWFFWDYSHPGTELIYFTGSSLGTGVNTGGVVAICHFTAIQPGISPLNFLGIDLRDPENSQIASDHSSGDSIIIDAAVDVWDVDLGYLKSVFR